MAAAYSHHPSYAPAPVSVPPQAQGPTPLSCPCCNTPASPAPGPQACARCTKRFVLSAGPVLDPNAAARVPPPHPGAGSIHLKWGELVLYKFANLDPVGITSGTLDPAIGMVPIDQTAVAFRDVVSIAAWRTIAWTKGIVGILVPAPIALLFFWGAIAARSSPIGALILALFGLLFSALAAYMIRGGFVIGNRHARVVGRYGAVTLRFEQDKRMWPELHRRSGLVAPPIP